MSAVDPDLAGSPPAVRLALGRDTPVADLRRVRQGLAQGLSSGRGLELDLSAMDALSSPAVATILFARRSCTARNLPFTVTGDRGRTRRTLRTCGLLDLPVGPS